MDAFAALATRVRRVRVASRRGRVRLDGVGHVARRGEWYLVAFRSVRRPDADEAAACRLRRAGPPGGRRRARVRPLLQGSGRARRDVPVVLPLDRRGRSARRGRPTGPPRGGLAAGRDVRALHARVPARDRADATARCRSSRTTRRSATTRVDRSAAGARPGAAPAALDGERVSRPRRSIRSDRPDRRSRSAAAIAPPTEVTSRIIAWTSSAIANAAFAVDAEPRGDPDRGQLERAEVARS